MTSKKKAIFLDRDGTLIEERGYICRLSESFIFPFAAPAVEKMNAGGFLVIGITNQSSIARGICTVEQVEAIHVEITRRLEAEGARLDRFYYCPYHPRGKVDLYRRVSDLRKPEPGMLLQAARDFGIGLEQSYMIGDSPIDIEAGRRAGCITVLVLTGKGKDTREELKKKDIQPDIVTENILTAVKEITG